MKITNLGKVQKAILKDILRCYEMEFERKDKMDAEVRTFFEQETPYDPKTDDEIDFLLLVEDWVRDQKAKIENGILTEQMVELIEYKGRLRTNTVGQDVLTAVSLPIRRDPIFWM